MLTPATRPYRHICAIWLGVRRSVVCMSRRSPPVCYGAWSCAICQYAIVLGRLRVS